MCSSNITAKVSSAVTVMYFFFKFTIQVHDMYSCIKEIMEDNTFKFMVEYRNFALLYTKIKINIKLYFA